MRGGSVSHRNCARMPNLIKYFKALQERSLNNPVLDQSQFPDVFTTFTTDQIRKCTVYTDRRPLDSMITRLPNYTSIKFADKEEYVHQPIPMSRQENDGFPLLEGPTPSYRKLITFKYTVKKNKLSKFIYSMQSIRLR